MKPKIIAQGAEAKIILNDNFIIKDRIKKSYRIPELDKKIRKQRTKAENKLLLKASKIINVPVPLIDSSSKKKNNKNIQTKIKMPYIKGKKLSQNLDKFQIKKQKQICKKIGESITKIHDENIIHGDLTTSNMILVEKKTVLTKKQASEFDGLGERELSQNFKIYFIDFGLGYFNGKTEDKAVDLHLLKQALEAKHFKNWKILWKSVESGYKKSNESRKVIERLNIVEKRGRYKKN